MRTNIVIDEQLIATAMELSGLKTKKDAVEAGLKALIQRKRQEKIREFRGKLAWDGDLEAMRLDNR